MFAISFLLLLEPAAPSPDQDFWLRIFKSACTEGNVILEESETKRVAWEEVIRPIKKHYKKVRDIANFYELQAGQPGYLIFFENSEPKSSDSRRGCAIAAQGLNLSYAYQKFHPPNHLNGRFDGPDGKPLHLSGFQIVSPELDYVIDAETVSRSYKIIQLSFVGKKQAKKLRDMDERTRRFLESKKSKED